MGRLSSLRMLARRYGSSLRPLKTSTGERGTELRTTWGGRRRRRVADKRDVVVDRHRHALHVQRQVGEATKQTIRVVQRVQRLTTILHASLADEIRPLDLDEMKTKVKLPALELGADARLELPPRWREFASPNWKTLFNLVFRRDQQRQAVSAARLAFEQALAHHHERETARQQRVVAATRRHHELCAFALSQVREKNREIDLFQRQLADHDRHAASKYFQLVLDKLSDPPGFPRSRRVGYAPESATLTVEWVLPQIDIIPKELEYRYRADRDEIVVHKWRSITEFRQIYHDMAAQVALRALNTVFAADPRSLVETVVFNGVVEEVGEITGRAIRPCVLTLCATRTRFSRLKLHDLGYPAEVIRKQFGARLSAHPEDLIEVSPVRPFILADPKIIQPAGDIDGARPDMLTFSLAELTPFLTELLDRMGLDILRVEPAGEGRLDCVVVDPTPVTGGKIVVHTRLGTAVVPPAGIRNLAGHTNRESALKGMLLTTSGFHPSSYGFANRKRLELYDGHSFLALCQQHRVPARIGPVANTCTPFHMPAQRQPVSAKPSPQI